MKLVSATCGVVGALVLASSVFGTGIANADDYAGLTYSEAVSRASDYKRTPIVSTVVGGRLPLDECIVTRAQAGTWPDMLFNLSCVALEATATTPGGSAMDAQSREFTAKKEAKDLAWKKTPDGQKWCAEALADHPEWAPIAGCAQN